MGRFLSPDWAAQMDPVPYAQLEDPQTLNLYAYVRSSPLRGIDADGHVENPLFPGISGDARALYDAQHQAPGRKAQQQSGQQRQGQNQTNSTPSVVTGAAADHQRALLLGLLGNLVPGDKSLDKELGSFSAGAASSLIAT